MIIIKALKAVCSVSVQVVMNKCFVPNPEKKIIADPSCRFREKRKNDALEFRKNDITEPKARLL